MSVQNLLKPIIYSFLFLSSSFLLGQSVEWMTNLDVAQRLARRQNKMILMTWEESTYIPLPVAVKDDKGKLRIVADLFATPALNEQLWEYFVPVRVDESVYFDLFNPIKGKRSSRYIDVFNDDSLKIMDANGNLVLVSGVLGVDFLNLDKLVEQYALNTKYIAKELEAYASNKDFFSTYYLASKYIDYSVFLPKRIRKEILALSTIYLNEAIALLPSVEGQNKVSLQQQLNLLPLKQELVLGKAKKVLRTLKKMDQSLFKPSTKAEVAFLQYTAHKILKDENAAYELRSKVSSLNLKKAQLIANINK